VLPTGLTFQTYLEPRTNATTPTFPHRFYATTTFYNRSHLIPGFACRFAERIPVKHHTYRLPPPAHKKARAGMRSNEHGGVADNAPVGITPFWRHLNYISGSSWTLPRTMM